jgi:hypothetical protein
MRGKQVAIIANQIYTAGQNDVNYNNSGLKAGLYIVTIEAGSISKQMKLIVR